jgi:hypothetical protein
MTGDVAEQASTPAVEFWWRGQQAMHAGAPAEALLWYRRCLQADPAFSRAYLSLAAAYLELEQPERACDYLARYVAAHPEHLLVRQQYGELLWKLHRWAAAQAVWQALIADAQELGESAVPLLIHCHSRLLDLAESRQDAYQAHLQRGIGLYLLAQQQRRQPAADRGEVSAEALLCRAAAELRRAQQLRPDAARPWWYLALVWGQLGQQASARRCLCAAQAAAPFSGRELTPAEQQRLALAGRLTQRAPR